MINLIKTNLKNYITHFPNEAELLTHLITQSDSGEDIISRSNFNGHVTASALIINSKNEVLVLWHNKLQKFLQPGGHLESVDNTLIDSSLREMEEESGISDGILHAWCRGENCPIMVDTHLIPENVKKNELAHYHHDFMFIFYTDSEKITLDENEVSDFKWIPINDVRNKDSLVGRALLKMQSLNL